MKPHSILSPPRRKLTVARIALLSLLVVVCGVGLVPGTAQSPAKEEREMEDTIPKHVPIKVKLKNPEKVKDLGNEDWLSDLEIEVTNTGDKPIYHLGLSLHLPDVKGENEGSVVGYYLWYGRIRLADISTPLESEDAPLLPGESCLLRVPDSSVRGWKQYKVRKNISNPKNLRLRLLSLNHGDGTGFRSPEGVPMPLKKRSSNAPCSDGGGKPGDAAATIYIPPNNFSSLTPHFLLPAKLMPANFLPTSSARLPLSPKAYQHGCCPGTAENCFHTRTGFITCQCGERPIAQSTSCSDPAGACFSTILVQETCTEFGGTCNRHEEDRRCDAPPGPTPTPTPTPSPSPEGCVDQDGDTFCANTFINQDCRDDDPEINPGQTEDCFNGVDDDCRGGPDGQDGQCRDSDGDGEADGTDCAPLDNRRSHRFSYLS